MLEKVEESLDLMITLKDAVDHYAVHVQERKQKCDEAVGKLPGFVTQLEKLVAQETELLQEVGALGDKLGDVTKRHRSMQEDLQIVNEIESLEERIREREQSRDDLLGRLNIGSARDEGVKLLDLDIEALAALRQKHVDALEERGVSRQKIRSIAPSLEAEMGRLTEERVRKEAELRELGKVREERMEEFTEFKLLEKERRTYEISSDHLAQLTQILNEVPLGADSIATEPGCE